MEPINFKEANKLLSKPQNMTDEECGSLPVYTNEKYCISCWKLSWKERLKILAYGKLWAFVFSGQTQPPIEFIIDKTVFKENE